MRAGVREKEETQESKARLDHESEPKERMTGEPNDSGMTFESRIRRKQKETAICFTRPATAGHILN